MGASFSIQRGKSPKLRDVFSIILYDSIGKTFERALGIAKKEKKPLTGNDLERLYDYIAAFTGNEMVNDIWEEFKEKQDELIEDIEVDSIEKMLDLPIRSQYSNGYYIFQQ